jgi:hypothetical protein
MSGLGQSPDKSNAQFAETGTHRALADLNDGGAKGNARMSAANATVVL